MPFDALLDHFADGFTLRFDLVEQRAGDLVRLRVWPSTTSSCYSGKIGILIAWQDCVEFALIEAHRC
jgi:hypothetical protein